MTPALPDQFSRTPIAHRALHDIGTGRPENSRSAIAAAIEAGYGIEIDLQLSADGVAMVFHDYDLDRLTAGTGPVLERSAAQLRATRLSGGRGDRIPPLPQALRALGGRTPIVVEIKRQAETGPLEQAVADALSVYDGPAAVMSFDPRSIAWFRDHAPEVLRGLVSYAFDDPEDGAGLGPEARAALADLAMFDEVEADFISYGVRDLPRPAVAALRARGAPVLCWTVRSAEMAEEALRHADAITFEGFRPPTGAAGA